MAVRALNEFIESKKFVAIGSLVIAALVFVTFSPALKGGFFGDDWWLVGKAAKLNLSQYLAFYFDPGFQKYWYRPLHGMLLLSEYTFFRSNPEGYHAIQILFHLVNCLLLVAIVVRLSGRWRLAFVASILYAGLGPGSWAVYWITVHDPLAIGFCLATVWFWIVYLQTQSRLHYLLAFGALVAALLSKESSIFLPVTLFLIDWLLIRQHISKMALFRRYIILGLTLLAYVTIAYQVQARGYFTNQQGYGFGPHVVDNALRYLGLLVFPWGLDQPASYIWLLTAASLCTVNVKLLKMTLPRRVILFLGIEALLAIAPALGFPAAMFEPRYLYAASMVSTIFVALLFEGVWKGLAKRKWYSVVIPVVTTLLVFLHISSTADAAVNAAEFSRQARVPLRDIFQQHPTFPPDTYLYFLDGCTLRILSGMFFLRYGPNVTIMCPDVEWGGVDPWGEKENRFAGLRDHKNSFVYYYDDARRRHEVVVDPSARSTAALPLPLDFQAPIRLEGYELTSTTLKRGDDLALLLYWRATGWIDKDYTVFVHLVDESGKLLVGRDSQPRNGFVPTSTWKKAKLIVDGHILPIPSDVPPGSNYRLAVGLYDLATMERVGIVDAEGRVITDMLVIEPFSVVE